MFRQVLQPLSRQLLQPTVRQGCLRCFTTARGSHEDKSLEGRYATALFRVSSQKNELDKVYADLETLRSALVESQDFRLFIETPSLTSQKKKTIVSDMVQKYGMAPTTNNVLQVLIENGRLSMLKKVIDSFEAFYREAKGELKCLVTSAKALDTKQAAMVRTAMQTRTGPDAKLIVEFATSPNILGGIIVRLGDRVMDFSVASRIERMQSQLMAPVVA